METQPFGLSIPKHTHTQTLYIVYMYINTHTYVYVQQYTQVCKCSEVPKTPMHCSLVASLPVVQQGRMAEPVHVVMETRARENRPLIAS